MATQNPYSKPYQIQQPPNRPPSHPYDPNDTRETNFYPREIPNYPNRLPQQPPNVPIGRGPNPEGPRYNPTNPGGNQRDVNDPSYFSRPQGRGPPPPPSDHVSFNPGAYPRHPNHGPPDVRNGERVPSRTFQDDVYQTPGTFHTPGRPGRFDHDLPPPSQIPSQLPPSYPNLPPHQGGAPIDPSRNPYTSTGNYGPGRNDPRGRPDYPVGLEGPMGFPREGRIPGLNQSKDDFYAPRNLGGLGPRYPQDPRGQLPPPNDIGAYYEKMGRQFVSRGNQVGPTNYPPDIDFKRGGPPLPPHNQINGVPRYPGSRYPGVSEGGPLFDERFNPRDIPYGPERGGQGRPHHQSFGPNNIPGQPREGFPGGDFYPPPPPHQPYREGREQPNLNRYKPGGDYPKTSYGQRNRHPMLPEDVLPGAAATISRYHLSPAAQKYRNQHLKIPDYELDRDVYGGGPSGIKRPPYGGGPHEGYPRGSEPPLRYPPSEYGGVQPSYLENEYKPTPFYPPYRDNAPYGVNIRSPGEFEPPLPQRPPHTPYGNPFTNGGAPQNLPPGLGPHQSPNYQRLGNPDYEQIIRGGPIPGNFDRNQALSRERYGGGGSKYGLPNKY